MSSALFLHQGAIGDFVLSLSVARQVGLALDCSRTVAIASSPVGRVAAGCGAIDQWLSPEQVRLHQLFADPPAVSRQLSMLLESATVVLSFLGGPDERVSRNLAKLCGPRAICIDPRPTAATIRDGRHITEQWARDIAAAGLELPVLNSPLVFDELRVSSIADAPESECLFNAVRPRGLKPAALFTAIHPGSGGRGKCWPLEQFMDLAEHIGPERIRWLLGPAELERGGFHETLSEKYPAEQIVCEPDLHQLAHFLASCSTYVGNDSGISHLAAALNVPSLVIFTATDPRIWRPLGEHVRIATPSTPAFVTTQQVRQIWFDSMSQSTQP